MKCKIYVYDLTNVLYKFLIHRTKPIVQIRCSPQQQEQLIELEQHNESNNIYSDHRSMMQENTNLKMIKKSHLNYWNFVTILTEFNLMNQFHRNFRNFLQKNNKIFVIFIHPPIKEVIDYKWNGITEQTAYERLEMDHLMSWLSTLGGGYSALGDSMERFAEIASKISICQLKLAMKLGDPSIVARSQLYMSIALIQKDRLSSAKQIILNIYNKAICNNEFDERLVKMCKGIWLKLQYAYYQRKQRNAAKIYLKTK